VCSGIPALLLLIGSSAYAQGVAPRRAAGDASLQKGSVETGGIFGATLPVTWLRAHSDRGLVMPLLFVGRVMTDQLGSGPFAGQFEFLLEVTPVVVLHQPARVFGVTASPLHMRWNFAELPGHRIRPFAEASGGIIYTNHPVPVRTTTFNFIDQAGFGLRAETGSRLAWLAGYRFQHISNAGRVKPNPGVNFNFAYVGVSYVR
jgi:hypothetical protein